MYLLQGSSGVVVEQQSRMRKVAGSTHPEEHFYSHIPGSTATYLLTCEVDLSKFQCKWDSLKVVVKGITIYPTCGCRLKLNNLQF